MPKAISLDITHRCNLNCIMCNRRLGIDNKDLTFENFIRIIDQIPTLDFIGFMGLGEVFLNKDFIPMLKECEKRRIDTMFTTNGVLLNKNNIKKLPKNVKQIYISIDSLNPKIYEKIRVNSKLSLVISNLKKLRRLRPEIKVTIQTLITKHNFRELIKFVNFANSIGANLNFILPMISFKELHDLHPHLYKEFPKEIKKAEELAKKLKVSLLSKPLQPEMNEKYVFCNEPWRCPYISLNGDVFACSFMFRVPEPKRSLTEHYYGVDVKVPVHKYIMGNLFNERFEDIWNNEKYKKLRKVVKSSITKKKLTPAQLNEIRKSIDSEKDFNYCKICLWRWNCSC